MVVMNGTLCHEIEGRSIRSSSFRMNYILSNVKCMGFTSNFSLTLSIYCFGTSTDSNQLAFQKPVDSNTLCFSFFL